MRDRLHKAEAAVRHLRRINSEVTIEGRVLDVDAGNIESLLDDVELAEAIREHLKEDGRIDSEELRILCRNGVVHLSGALPSEPEHQILLQIVTDILGLKEVVDRIQLEELVWERESRTKESPPEVLLPGQEPPGTEDIVESGEEGKEFTAPAKPTPEEE